MLGCTCNITQFIARYLSGNKELSLDNCVSDYLLIIPTIWIYVVKLLFLENEISYKGELFMFYARGGHWQNFRKSRARKYRVDFIQDI